MGEPYVWLTAVASVLNFPRHATVLSALFPLHLYYSFSVVALCICHAFLANKNNVHLYIHNSIYPVETRTDDDMGKDCVSSTYCKRWFHTFSYREIVNKYKCKDFGFGKNHMEIWGYCIELCNYSKVQVTLVTWINVIFIYTHSHLKKIIITTARSQIIY